jgi:hypothetical protein
MSAGDKISVREKIGYSLGTRPVTLYLTRPWLFWLIFIPIFMACRPP